MLVCYTAFPYNEKIQTSKNHLQNYIVIFMIQKYKLIFPVKSYPLPFFSLAQLLHTDTSSFISRFLERCFLKHLPCRIICLQWGNAVSLA